MLKKAVRWFRSRERDPEDAWDVIVWWEYRRIPYNFIVGAAGIASLVLFFVFIGYSGILKPGEDAVEPLAILCAPVAINICYTAGWILELFIRVCGVRDRRLGPIILAVGTVFSLMAVAAPAVLWGLFCVVKVITGTA